MNVNSRQICPRRISGRLKARNDEALTADLENSRSRIKIPAMPKQTYLISPLI